MRALITLVLLFAWLPLEAATIAERIEQAAESETALRGAFWGAKVVQAETGAVLFEHLAENYFLPASNAKLFSTALALRRLGATYRFRTSLVADRAPDANGVIRGDLRFAGGGDPTLSARTYPYRKGPVRGNQLSAVEGLADLLVEKGVRRIEGDIVGDDSTYPWEPYPDGWGMEDMTWDYGAPVSALVLHDNTFKLTILPGRRVGEPARLLLDPATEYYQIHNRVQTVSQGETVVSVDWPAGSREITVFGRVRPGDVRSKLLAIRDPAHYAAWELREALGRRGVVITGEARARHRWLHEAREGGPPAAGDGVVLVSRLSPPLGEILQVVNKTSQNLHAELLLREVGRVGRQAGTRDAGLSELRAFLAEAGVRPREFDFADASGLSRLDLVTPAATVKLLISVYQSEDRAVWMESLAVGGEDGTLDYRFRGATNSGGVRAKTGTMTHVSALSGYAESATHGTVVFSIYVNNYTASDAAARGFIDGVVRMLME